MRYATSQEVAKGFGRHQDEALAESPVTVTRYGRPTVVILSYAEYERLSGRRAPRPEREVFRVGEMPDDLLDAIAAAEPPAEAERFNDEHGTNRDGAA